MGGLRSREVCTTTAYFYSLFLIQTRQQDREFHFSDHTSAEDHGILGDESPNSCSAPLEPPISDEETGICE